mmetsp:Transcript_37228/g.111444  ORF Transcript_37228/g.111444 Transcript_37228/m.111444 type:complete len:204 (-) Transcript_37228:284-895(-)
MFCRNTCKAEILEEQPSISAGRTENERLPECPKRALLHEVVYFDIASREELRGPPAYIQMGLVMKRPWSKKGDQEVPIYSTETIRGDKLVSAMPSHLRYLCLRPDRCYTATFERSTSLSLTPLEEDEIIVWVVRRVIRKHSIWGANTKGNGGGPSSLVVASGEVRPLAKGLCSFAPWQSKRFTAAAPSCEEACSTLILTDLKA